MNVIDYITITCNINKCPITDYIRLHDKMQSITTDYDYKLRWPHVCQSASTTACWSSILLFPAIYRVDTCFCFDICKRFLNFPLPTCFYLRNPLFYIISWIIYYLKSCIIFLNFISFQWFCQFYFILICFLWSDHVICKSFHM
jgi:hypothetical protein